MYILYIYGYNNVKYLFIFTVKTNYWKFPKGYLGGMLISITFISNLSPFPYM